MTQRSRDTTHPLGFQSTGRSQDHGALTVSDSLAQFFCGESTKDDGEDGSDTCASQHSKGRLRYFGHIDDDDITLSNSSSLEYSGKSLYLFQGLTISDLPILLLLEWQWTDVMEYSPIC